MRIFSTTTLLSLFILILVASCGSTQEIKQGQTAYELKKYNLAVQLFKQEFEKTSDPEEKADIAYKVAESYRRMNDTEDAQEWYRQAWQLGVGKDSRFWYARMLQANRNFEEAIAQYQGIIEEEPYRRPELSKAIASCKQAQQWLSEEQHTSIENLESINSVNSDFSPVYFRNKQLVFTSNRSSATGEEKDKWTGKNYFDLFVTPANKANGFGTPEGFSLKVNGPYNDGPGTFNQSYNVLYYTHCGTDMRDQTDYCGIWVSQRAPEGGWTDPVPLKLFPDSINIGQPALSPDGEALIFAATDPQGYGGSDLFFVAKTIEGWSTPINLGAAINTEYDEAFPGFDEEGNLYFASNGHPGMGGLDIFKSLKDGKNKWGKPEQLPYPINSAGDDFGILVETLSPQEQVNYYMKGYLSSSRAGGKGADDIYYFERAKPPATFELIAQVNTPKYADSLNPDSEIIDSIPLSNAIVVLNRKTSQRQEVPDTFYTDENGMIKSSLSAETDYELFASKGENFFNQTKDVSTRPFTPMPGENYTVETEITLERIFKEREIVIPNIYYDFNESFIREDAAAVLDTTIYELLVNNPNLIIELGSHTDSRGSDKFNRELSEKRAQAVVDYLVQKGINRDRMVAKGYGETQLVNECDDGVECTEEEHQRNRRTTFRVLGSDFEAKSVEPEDIKVDPKEE